MTAKAIAYWKAQGNAASDRNADSIEAFMNGGTATRQTMLAIRKGEIKGKEKKPKSQKKSKGKSKKSG